jgi:hypothetical protein
MDSDFALHALAGGFAVTLAALAWIADHRRMRRSDPDAVGFMPWTGIFFWALLAACTFLGPAAKEWFIS